MDVKGPDDVGLIGDAGSGDVWIMNRREVNDGFGIDHGFYDLAKVLNVANKVFDSASLRTGQAVKYSDFMGSTVEQFAHDPSTDFADPTSDENLHYANALIYIEKCTTEAQRSRRKGFIKITLRALWSEKRRPPFDQAQDERLRI